MFGISALTKRVLSRQLLTVYRGFSTMSTNMTVPFTKITLRSVSARQFSADTDDHHGAFERKLPTNPEDAISFNVVDRNGVTHAVKGKVGDNLLFLCRIFQETDPVLFLEGACEASLGCSTCHVILDDNTFHSLEPALDEEEDLLDQAACLAPTSRLACQLELSKDWEGATVSLPKFSRNFYVDGHVPQPH